MNSPTTTSPRSKDYPRWARNVRKDKLPANMVEHLKELEEFFDHYAESVEKWRQRNEGYHRTISTLSRFYVPPSARVLEIGSGTGDLLASTAPRRGLGIDISPE